LRQLLSNGKAQLAVIPVQMWSARGPIPDFHGVSWRSR
jgi:hypothetical protein